MTYNELHNLIIAFTKLYIGPYILNYEEIEAWQDLMKTLHLIASILATIKATTKFNNKYSEISDDEYIYGVFDISKFLCIEDLDKIDLVNGAIYDCTDKRVIGD